MQHFSECYKCVYQRVLLGSLLNCIVLHLLHRAFLFERALLLLPLSTFLSLLFIPLSGVF